MDLIRFLPVVPLPVLSLLLPFLGAFILLSLRIYEKVISRYRNTLLRINVNLRMLKIIYILLLLANVIITFIIWKNLGVEGFSVYILSDSVWAHTLTGGSSVGIMALLQVDALGAVSALLMAVIAFFAGLRALADKKNVLTTSKTACFLVTLCGIQGIFYSNGLFSILFFLCLSQIGASGLFHGLHSRKEEYKSLIWYYSSRIVPLIMFFMGATILFFNYKTDNIALLSTAIKLGTEQKFAYALLVVPLLFLFVKSAAYVTDSAKRCFFAIRAQAAFFVVFRIVFSLYGPIPGLEKIPVLFIGAGVILLFAALIFTANEKDPVRFAEFLELFMKGFLLVSIGISISGMYSAENVAEYGFGAIESMVTLWLIFLPVSACLSFVCCMLKQEVEGVELCRRSGLLMKIPLSAIALFLAICVISGLPPFVGFPAKQFLFRSANYISPSLTLLLLISSLLLLLMGLRYFASVMFGKFPFDNSERIEGEVSITLPLLFLIIFLGISTAMSGRMFDLLVSPSVYSLMNRGQLINAIQQEGNTNDL